MHVIKKIWLNGFVKGAAVALLLCCGLYYWENGKLPLIGDTLVSGYSGKKVSAIEKIIDRHFLGEVDKEELEDYMCYGIMSALDDKYSSYFSAEDFEKAMEASNGVYVGVGMVMEQDTQTKEVTVSQCYPDSPAAKAGIQAGDVIYKVKDQIVSEITISELSSLIMAEKSVVFYIQREGLSELLELEVELGEVEVPSVYSRKLDGEIGYIQIIEFTDVTSKQFETAYQGLLGEGIKGLMIDLRENPGGLMSAVCDTLRQILPKGLIVYTEDKQGNRKEETCKGKTPIEIPLVLLINEDSASAAEIFAAAVKDYEIGSLVGTTTFGKGIVQKYYPFTDGSAVKITVSKYYTPKGVCIHGEGVAPNVEAVWDGEEAFSKPSAYNELELREWQEKDNQFEKGLEVLSELMREE